MIDPVIMAIAAQLRLSTPIDLDLRQTECIADAIYHEARSEPLDAQIAVASVVLNRGNPCTVIREPRQFSYRRRKRVELSAWRQSSEVALLVHSGAIKSHDVTHFHDVSVRPRWSKHLTFYGQSGKMRFYNEVVRNSQQSR